MPIYAYKCASCGHALDTLRKLTDPVLTDCPACGEPALRKQLTAAGFQLKGSGWYATDFRNNGSAPAKKDDAAAPDAAPDQSAEKPVEKAADNPLGDNKPAKPKPKPEAAPAAALPAAPAADSSS